MRILFVTNFYPPHELGGQGRSCQQVIDGLQARGHQTAVLTSMNGVNNSPVQEDGVYRHLYLEMDFVPWRQSVTFFTQRRRRERANLQRIDDVLDAFQPHVIFIWGMWNLPRSVPRHLEQQAVQGTAHVVYRFADYWPTLPSQHELYWRKEGRTWYSRLPKRLIAGLALRMLQSERREQNLQFPHSICVSAATREYLLQAGVPVDNAVIVHNGIDLARYNSWPKQGRSEKRLGDVRAARSLKLLYAGRLHPTKGVDTAIEALARLQQQHGRTDVELTIAGSGDQAHLTRFKRLAADISDHVTFLGQVPHEAMPALMRRHHVLLLPSRWPEPFARTPLEAMASGLAVVATPLGGTAELIDDGHNGLLFAPGDAAGLAQKLVQLLDDPPLRTTLAQAAYTRIAQEFTLETMLDKMETVLHAAASSEPVHVPS